MVELEVDLLDNGTKSFVTAVARDLDLPKDTLSWYLDWFPEMHDLSGNPIFEDSHWHVPKIWDVSAKNPSDQVIIIELNNRIQGYVVTKVGSYKGKDNHNCTYIKFLATAPWNRKITGRSRAYSNAGKMLLAVSIIIGYWNNKNAAVELEALPQAENFYRKQGMLPTGKQKNGMLQYRFDHKAAISFVRQIQANIRRKGGKP